MKQSTHNPANLLFATDLHLHAPAYEAVARQLEGHAALLLGGDLLDAPEGCNELTQLRTLQSLLTHLAVPGKPLVWCDGNHDQIAHSQALALLGLPPIGQPTVIAVPGGAVEILTSPWNGSVRNMEIPPRLPGAFRILLHHAPPTGTQCAIDLHSGQDFGSFDLRDWLEWGGQEHVDLVLSGHVHTPEHWWCDVGRTLCINPGEVSDPDNQPMVSIDPFGGSVTLLQNGAPVDRLRFTRVRSS